MLRHLAPRPARSPRGRRLATAVEALPACLGHRADISLPNTACLRGRSAVGRLAQNGQFWGSRGTVLLEAAGAFVAAPAARRSWFCYYQLAVLLLFERRRTGLLEVAALGRAFSWPRAWGS